MVDLSFMETLQLAKLPIKHVKHKSEHVGKELTSATTLAAYTQKSDLIDC